MKKLIRALFICTVALVIGVGIFQVNVAKAEPIWCEDYCGGASPYMACHCLGSPYIETTCQQYYLGYCF